MNTSEIEKIDADFRKFATKNFEKPSNCKNVDQIRFYIGELQAKMNQYETHYRYVPESAKVLMKQYSAAQHRLMDIKWVKEHV